MGSGVSEWVVMRGRGDLFVFSPSAISAPCDLKSVCCGFAAKIRIYNLANARPYAETAPFHVLSSWFKTEIGYLYCVYASFVRALARFLQS